MLQNFSVIFTFLLAFFFNLYVINQYFIYSICIVLELLYKETKISYRIIEVYKMSYFRFLLISLLSSNSLFFLSLFFFFFLYIYNIYSIIYIYTVCIFKALCFKSSIFYKGKCCINNKNF
jgi:hypothetical protein